MALKGTIKDFGVADIFQLISQQGKTGVLVLNNDVDEVRVFFKSGSVVRAENAQRPAQMLLGNILVRAETITEAQLELGLSEQRKSLKRIGAVLIELGLIDPPSIAEFATLQLTETIYALFEWKIGTYEFESIDVEPAPEGVEPIRAETIVMNGIRMTDEWPGIREKIPAYGWMVEAVRPLPPETAASENSSEFNFSDFGESTSNSPFSEIGHYERQIYELIAPGRSVQKLIDLSRMGEFEACRALGTLMGSGFIRIIKPEAVEALELDGPKDRSGGYLGWGLNVLGRMVVSAALVFAAALLVVRWIQPAPAPELRFEARTVDRKFAQAQLRVIKRALEVYRLEQGVYPQSLQQLIDADILEPNAVRYPFERPYFYRPQGETFELLLPLY